MSVGYQQIEVATALLLQVAFSGGEGADPEAVLAFWRQREGIEEGALERAASQSADETLEEIERAREDGEFSIHDLRQYIEREYVSAFQVGWVTRARLDARNGGGDAH